MVSLGEVALVHHIRDELPRVGRPEHCRRLDHILGALLHHECGRRQRRGVVIEPFAVAAELHLLAGRLHAQPQVVIANEGGESSIRREALGPLAGPGALRVGRRWPLRAVVRREVARPCGLIDRDLKLAVGAERDGLERQRAGRVRFPDYAREHRRQPLVIERRLSRGLCRIDEDELLAGGPVVQVPEPGGAVDPARRDLAAEGQRLDRVADEPLGAPVVIEGALGAQRGNRASGDGQRNEESGSSVHGGSIRAARQRSLGRRSPVTPLVDLVGGDQWWS